MDIRSYCIVEKKEDEQAYLYQEKILNDKKMMQEEKIILQLFLLTDCRIMKLRLKCCMI